jgi:hypothetical protein
MDLCDCSSCSNVFFIISATGTTYHVQVWRSSLSFHQQRFIVWVSGLVFHSISLFAPLHHHLLLLLRFIVWVSGLGSGV